MQHHLAEAEHVESVITLFRVTSCVPCACSSAATAAGRAAACKVHMLSSGILNSISTRCLANVLLLLLRKYAMPTQRCCDIITSACISRTQPGPGMLACCEPVRRVLKSQTILLAVKPPNIRTTSVRDNALRFVGNG